jgi:hypothetical protein
LIKKSIEKNKLDQLCRLNKLIIEVTTEWWNQREKRESVSFGTVHHPSYDQLFSAIDNHFVNLEKVNAH